MARCFCGCDEPVKGLAARGHNKQGRRTVEQIEKLTRLKGRSLGLAEELEVIEGTLPGTHLGASGANSVVALDALAQSLGQMVDTGRDYADTWHSILHDGYLPIEGVMDYKRSWLAWGKASMAVTSMLTSSDEDLITFALVANNDETEV